MAGPECQTLGILATDNHAPDNQIIIASDNACVKYRCELAFISVSDSKVQITTLMLRWDPCLCRHVAALHCMASMLKYLCLKTVTYRFCVF